MTQVHGAPLHPQTQGKIERYHRSMKNVIKLQNYYSPDELREAILKKREELKQKAFEQRREIYFSSKEDKNENND